MVASGKIMKVLDLSQQTGVNALIERAYYYSISGKTEEAEACYLAAVEKDPADFNALYGLTILMINKNELQKAEAWLDRASSSKNVISSAILYPTILIAIHKDDKLQAEKLLKEATQKYPEDERFWKLRAFFLLKQGDFRAVRHQLLPEMTKALKDPEHYLIHIVRGLMLKQQGPAFYREARISLLKGLSLNASMTETWDTVLQLDMMIGNLELMEGDIQHLLILQPDHAHANYMKGSIQLKRGKLQSAEDFIRRSIEKMPTAVACNDLAELLRRQKKLKEAKEFAHQAIELDPKLPNARATLAAILTDAEKEVSKD
jgi:tetratricopeptide (TPR) repeat protein